ncbi:GspE/PulE family protein [Azospirillum sp.]|uniref:GspE/PulE family protein n=1 Tax=Azospirillum sp. TaxID=34012 RepID=UPI002D28E338|nr:GspE/PulE family protein [Azospirillum sp.]HYD69057.1 GspE/PulE family protein [Azospirillum sp.]
MDAATPPVHRVGPTDSVPADRAGFATREEARRAAVALGLPYAPPERLAALPPEAAAVSTNFLRTARAFPFAVEHGRLLVALADPQDAATVEALEVATGLPVQPHAAFAADVEAALERCGGPSALERIVADFEGGGAPEEDLDQLKSLASEAPVVRLVNHLISEAVRQGASDIHIEPFPDALRVRLRIDGVLREMEPAPVRLARAVVSRVKILANLNIAERRLPQDGRIGHRVPGGIGGRQIDLRISTLPTVHGESVVIRLLDPTAGLRPLSDLGFGASEEVVIRRLIAAPHGMVLVTGPTGSGKTTTLYAALNLIDAATRKILTVEDPVEYHLARVNQVQVKPAIGLDFATVLRALVRQDPDVIMIGETRDHETAEIAVHAALTGHLVLTTLHTNSAAGAITRLLDMGVEPFLLTSTVRAVIGQRLVRVLCRHCKHMEPDGTARPVGCERCGGTGYAGRMGLYELLVMDEPLRALTMQRAGADVLEAQAVAAGMVTLHADGLAKVAQGLTTLEEVRRVTDVW